MGKRLFCDNCGHNETKENPVFLMTFFMGSMDPNAALTCMRVGQPNPNRPKSSSEHPIVGGKQLKEEFCRDLPKVENWKETEYTGPSSDILYLGSQELCLTCIKSIANDMSAKFKNIQDHGTHNECINSEERKPNTIVTLPNGSTTTVEEVAKLKAQVAEQFANKLPDTFSDAEKIEGFKEEIKDEVKS